MADPAIRRTTYAEYLALEQLTGVKHEYIEGYTVAMAGGTSAHADVGQNVLVWLANALRGRPCRPSNSDQRVRVASADFSSYPDVSVFCGPRVPDALDPDAFTNPTVLVEVLSASTEAYDRGEKFGYYRQISPLRHYVLVSSTEARVEVFSRNADDSWTLRVYGPGAEVALDALDLMLPVDAVYGGVTFTPRGRPPARTVSTDAA